MKRVEITLGLVACSYLVGCAHSGRETNTFYLGAFASDGVTYYPAHPGTTTSRVVEFTTNRPPAGVRPFVTVVTTNAQWEAKLLDGPGLLSTKAPIK